LKKKLMGTNRQESHPKVVIRYSQDSLEHAERVLRSREYCRLQAPSALKASKIGMNLLTPGVGPAIIS
jgi:hypothetical protein